MNVVSAVANLVKERDYYRDLVSEAQDVIRQLTEGPGNIEYIHPMDLANVLNDMTITGANVIKDDGYTASGKDIEIIEAVGSKKKYRQSIMMPRTKIKAEVI